MPMGAIQVYLDRLPDRQGELKLMLAEAASFPWMDGKDRGRAMRAWGGQKPEPLPIQAMPVVGLGVEFVGRE